MEVFKKVKINKLIITEIMYDQGSKLSNCKRGISKTGKCSTLQLKFLADFARIVLTSW